MMQNQVRPPRSLRSRSWKRSLTRYWQMYLLLIPVIVYFIIFRYKPLLGIQIAFKDYKLRAGMWHSKWVGLKHFRRFFPSYQSGLVITNTLWISFLSLLFCFPFPIILALIFNELKTDKGKRFVRTVTYAPHFVSTVVVVGMMVSMCAMETGIINKFLVNLGLTKEPLYLMGSGKGHYHPVRGDYDLMTQDKEEIARLGLDKLRFGDIVLLEDQDNTWGRAHCKGASTIGVIIHGESDRMGHGPGITTILSSRKPIIEGVIDESANLATYFGAK